MSYGISDDGLGRALERISVKKYNLVVNDNLRQMFNRAKGSGIGGTPVDTGELRQSVNITMSGAEEGEIGYTKSYGPHVEFGHRTRGGGFVPGQRFLKANADAQSETFTQDLLKAIQEVI